MGFIMSMASLAMSILYFSLGIAVFFMILGPGRKVLKEMLSTLGDLILVGCGKIRKSMLKDLRKENAKREEKMSDFEKAQKEFDDAFREASST